MKNGFTLIELLVVVLIIGILAAVALPQYQKAVLRARTAEGLTAIKNMEQAQQAYWLANGEFTADLSSLDIEQAWFNCYTNYCHFKSKGEEFLWEITLTNQKRGYFTYCAAEPANKEAIAVCASVGRFYHKNGPRDYYLMNSFP